MNSYLTGVSEHYLGPRIDDNTFLPYVGQPLASVVSPEEKILLGDEYHSSPYSGPILWPSISSTYAGSYYQYPLDEVCLPASAAYCTSTALPGWLAHGRHFSGANIAFIDGHVKFVAPNTPGLMFPDIGTCSVGGNGSGCPTYYGTNQFIQYWNPTTDKPF
jgi:prepilin-type processing-associated H-X9-DG protein